MTTCLSALLGPTLATAQVAPTLWKNVAAQPATEVARRRLEVPAEDTLKGVRARTILATLLYHGLRREELCGLRVKDIQSREGVKHFNGKGDKIRYVPLHPLAQRLIEEFLLLTRHGKELNAPLFRPVSNNRTGTLTQPLNTNSIYRNIVRKY